MDTFKHIAVMAASIVLIWFSAAIVVVGTQNTEIEDAAVILAFLATLVFGLVAGLSMLAQVSGNKASQQQKKAKRGIPGESQDARLALLLALLSEEERASIKSRLIDDLAADGEALSLGELLAAQEAERERYR